MTNHSGAADSGEGSAAGAPRSALGGERGVSERIYDYIRTGRADQHDRRGARPAASSARS